MISFVDLFQPFPGDVGINLSCGYVRVSQHDLNRSQIGSTFQKMSCERMSEFVRSDLLFDPRTPSILLDDLPESLSGDRASP